MPCKPAQLAWTSSVVCTSAWAHSWKKMKSCTSGGRALSLAWFHVMTYPESVRTAFPVKPPAWLGSASTSSTFLPSATQLPGLPSENVNAPAASDESRHATAQAAANPWLNHVDLRRIKELPPD